MNAHIRVRHRTSEYAVVLSVFQAQNCTGVLGTRSIANCVLGALELRNMC
jgi:hypothetical protein